MGRETVRSGYTTRCNTCWTARSGLPLTRWASPRRMAGLLDLDADRLQPAECLAWAVVEFGLR
jgi:hypothetical protein